MTTPTRAARAAAMHRHLDDRLESLEYCAERLVECGIRRPRRRPRRLARAPLDDRAARALALRRRRVRRLVRPRDTGGVAERYVPPSPDTIDAAQVEHALNLRCVRQYLVRERKWRHTEVDRALDDLVHDEAIRLVAEDDGDVRIELVKRPGEGRVSKRPRRGNRTAEAAT